MLEDNKERNRKYKREWEQNKRARDPEYVKKRREYDRERKKCKYATDPEYAEKMRQRRRKYYIKRTDEEKEEIKRNKKAVKNDPQYIENKREYMRKWQRNYRKTSKYKNKEKKPLTPEQKERKRVYQVNYHKNVLKTNKEFILKRELYQKGRYLKIRNDEMLLARRRERAKILARENRKKNPALYLHHIVSIGVSNALKRMGAKKINRVLNIVPFTIDELKSHLESKFTDGMTWENYGRHGWHLDHIKPVVSFNFTCETDSEFLECWALSNLQPLWETTRIINGVEYIGNLNKSSKII